MKTRLSLWLASCLVLSAPSSSPAGESAPCDCPAPQCASAPAADCGWDLEAGALLLGRYADNTPMLIDSGAAPRVSQSDFDSNSAVGYELAALRRGDGVAAEVRYFRVDSFDEAIDGVAAASDTIGGVSIGGADPYHAGYKSQIDSFELNLSTNRHGAVDYLIGFRHVRLREGLHFSFPDIPALVTSQTDNRLYGVQMGANARLLGCGPCDRLTLSGTGRLGGLFGESTSRLAVQNGVNSTPAADADQLSLLAELGLKGRLRLTPGLDLTAGYRLLWLNDVALAGSQLTTTNFLGGGSTAVSHDNALFHGLTAGLTATW